MLRTGLKHIFRTRQHTNFFLNNSCHVRIYGNARFSSALAPLTGYGQPARIEHWRQQSTVAQKSQDYQTTGSSIRSNAESKLMSVLVQLHPDREEITLRWSDSEKEEEATFHATWLKHNCHCTRCKQEHTGQKIADVYNFNPWYSIKNAKVDGDLLLVEWDEDDGHVGMFPLSYLRDNSYNDDVLHKARISRNPTFLSDGLIPQIHCDDIMTSEKALLQWLLHLNEVGLCLVKGVPSKKGAIKEVVQRIWLIQHTIYGEIFDVVSTPNPINIAYSSVGLPYHMDLVYYESPPGIQFLHCLQLDPCVQGGENYFLDTFLVAQKLKELYLEYFKTLVRVPATFQKIHFEREDPVSMSYQRPHIVVNHLGDIIGVNWAPAFEGPLKVTHSDVKPYYKAYQQFAKMMRDSDARVTYRMDEGDMLSFNNRRILHARAGFDLNGGVRHLQGCYVNIDEFKSRFEVLSRLHGDGKRAKRVANNDFQ